jgi:hypothetical protein
VVIVNYKLDVVVQQLYDQRLDATVGCSRESRGEADRPAVRPWVGGRIKRVEFTSLRLHSCAEQLIGPAQDRVPFARQDAT